jgi:tyrosine-protein kinase Etk/Wzc
MEQDEIDLAEILDTLYLQWKLIAAIVASFVLFGLIYIILAKPIYQADLLIQIENPENPAKAALGDIAQLFQSRSEASAEIEIVRSRLVVSKAVDNLHLDFEAHPRYFPLIGAWIARRNPGLSEPGLLGMGGYAWGNESIEVSQFDVPESFIDKTFYLTTENNKHYRLEGDGVSGEGSIGDPLKIDTKDGVIELRVENINANPGVQFVLRHHSHLKAVERLQNQLNIGEKIRNSDILSVKLQGPDRHLITNVLNEVGTQYVLQNIERKSAEAEKTLTFLDKFLPELKSSLDAAEAHYISVSTAHGTVDIAEEVKLILKRLVDAKTKAGELKVRRDELLYRLTPEHPAVKAIDAQIAGVQAEIASINSQISKMPGLERKVIGLSRDVKIDSELYTNLLTTAQQLRLLKAGSVGNVRIIDDAVVPEDPVKPRRLLILILSLVLGLAVGIAAALLRRHLSGGILNAFEIEEQIGLKVFATVPQSKRQESLNREIQAKASGMFVLEHVDTNDLAIESLRSFRTSLQFAMLEARNNRIIISGATPGVGKSFISVNFAAVMAASGKRVLLIDMDLRKGHLNQYFGLARESGAAELIAGTLTFDQVVRRDILPNLDFIPTGALPDNPNSLLMHDNMNRILENASSKFDLVLLDTPPVIAVTDAAVLSERVGTFVLVARESVSTLGEINESVKRLNQVGVVLAGVLFNGVHSRFGRYGYSHGKYRYTSQVYEQYRSLD